MSDERFVVEETPHNYPLRYAIAEHKAPHDIKHHGYEDDPDAAAAACEVLNKKHRKRWEVRHTDGGNLIIWDNKKNRQAFVRWREGEDVEGAELAESIVKFLNGEPGEALTYRPSS